jgi:hypothetical protein
VEQLNRYISTWIPSRVSGVPYIVSWRTALSNVDWTEYADGLGVCYRDGHGERALVLCDSAQLNRSNAHAVDCLYTVDDGTDALPYFVTGWCLYPDAKRCNVDLPSGYVTLRRMRPHAPVGGFGPRRSWHLLISPIEAEGEVS